MVIKTLYGSNVVLRQIMINKIKQPLYKIIAYLRNRWIERKGKSRYVIDKKEQFHIK